MDNVDDIRVFLLYTSGYGRVASFYNLNNSTATMEIEDYNAEYFWNMGGGLRIVLNECYTIFHSTSFDYLLDCVYFLIDSFYFVLGQYSNCRYLLETNGLIPKILFRTAMNEYITIINSSAENFTLSYLQGESVLPSSRGSFYFNGLVLSRRLWVDAILVAIKEFQFQLEGALTRTSEGDNKIMCDLSRDLKRILMGLKNS